MCPEGGPHRPYPCWHLPLLPTLLDNTQVVSYHTSICVATQSFLRDYDHHTFQTLLSDTLNTGIYVVTLRLVWPRSLLVPRSISTGPDHTYVRTHGINT